MNSCQFLDISQEQLIMALGILEGLKERGKFVDELSAEIIGIFFKGLARKEISVAELYFSSELSEEEQLVAQATYCELLH